MLLKLLSISSYNPFTNENIANIKLKLTICKKLFQVLFFSYNVYSIKNIITRFARSSFYLKSSIFLLLVKVSLCLYNFHEIRNSTKLFPLIFLQRFSYKATSEKQLNGFSMSHKGISRGIKNYLKLP